MNLSRRFLRTAALAAVFALGLAGTALAAPATYVITGNQTWTSGGIAGGSTPTATDDTVIIKEGAVLTATLGTAVIDVKVLDMAGGTLILEGTAFPLKIAGGGEIRVSKGGSIQLKGAVGDGAITFAAANAPVILSDDAFLTIERTGNGSIAGNADKWTIKGKGRVALGAPVKTVNAIDLKEGATLEVNTGNVLPNLADDDLTITKGSLVINGEGFGPSSVHTLILSDGNLTLNKPLGDKFKVKISGDLTVANEGTIGNEATPDGEVELTHSGRLFLNKDLKLKELTTTDNSRIWVDEGKTLTVKPGDALDLKAEVKGNLSLELAANKTATLHKDVYDGTVTFAGNSVGAPTLALSQDVFVNAIDITGANNEPSKLELKGNNYVDTLKFAKTTTSFEATSSGDDNEIGRLEPEIGATLKVGGSLYINDGPSVDWNVNVGNSSELFVGKELLSGMVTATLGGGTLILPSGEYRGLNLLSNSANSVIEVGPATERPVLKVNSIDISAAGMKMAVPTTWKTAPESGDTITLLEADAVDAGGGSNVVKGEPTPEPNGYWEVADLDESNKVLVLTAKKAFPIPVLDPKVEVSGNECLVNVTVSGDVFVDPTKWRAKRLSAVAPGSIESVTKESATQKTASFKVVLSPNFISGTLRVRATNNTPPSFKGFVDVELKKAGSGGGGGGGGAPGTPGTPAAPSIDPSSWETTSTSAPDAQGNVTVQLAATLKLEGTPKSLDVVASGMKEKPKAELLDDSGKVVVSSMPSVVRASAKSYKLRLTCKTTKADIDAGKAAIEKVLVTTDDGKAHTIMVNKKLKDIAKSGGKPGQPNPGQPNPGQPGNPGQPDNPGDSKSSSGGGCDAGWSGLALALAAALLLKRKA